MIDLLIEKIKQKQNPTCVGLDTALNYLPEEQLKGVASPEDAGKAITEFNMALIDRLSPIIPSVKVQVAYYEMYGVPGMQAFRDTLVYAKSKGLAVISDVKRNDIGSTAECYSRAYLGGTEIGGSLYESFPSDFVTVNGYLGSDGLKPFLKNCKANKKGIFVLVKTSNPSSGELQDKTFQSGKTLYEEMGSLITELGADLVGSYGYSSVGAVVGATHREQAQRIRQEFPKLFFLIPGYGAQGGAADDLAVCFDRRGLGGIVNSSRGIICAYRQEKYRGMSAADAAYAAAVDMQQDIDGAIRRHTAAL